MLLNQNEVLQRLVPENVRELQIQLQIPQLEERARELVPQHAHVHRQRPLFLLLAGEVVHRFVLLRVYVQQLSARVVVAHAVLAESDEAIVFERAQNLRGGLCEGLRVRDRELLDDVRAGVHLLIRRSRARRRRPC